MKFASTSEAFLLAFSAAASACMVVDIIYDHPSDTIRDGLLWDNNSVPNCFIAGAHLPFTEDNASADFSCPTLGYSAKVHSNGNGDFWMKVGHEGKTLRFALQQKCSEWAENYDLGSGRSETCVQYQLSAFEYGCKEGEKNIINGVNGASKARKGALSVLDHPLLG